MGPGFQSAYGMVMAIHHKVMPGGGLFDNQIRTHGSVDYTSIARRFSHGCHRLVNARAVRLFGFVLRHRPYERLGRRPLKLKKYFQVEDPNGGEPRKFGYEMTTRGYYYELRPPVPVNVLEGRVMGDGEAGRSPPTCPSRAWTTATRGRSRARRWSGRDGGPNRGYQSFRRPAWAPPAGTGRSAAW